MVQLSKKSCEIGPWSVEDNNKLADNVKNFYSIGRWSWSMVAGHVTSPSKLESLPRVPFSKQSPLNDCHHLAMIVFYLMTTTTNVLTKVVRFANKKCLFNVFQ